ncbi:MAG: DUF6496 domain-containing protein [Candidatus Methylomirabilales bacterium]
MPEKKAVQRAQAAKRKGKAASTQAGEFVREEMEHYKEGKHGSRVKSRKQAVAVALSKARRAGAALKPPAKGKTSAATREKAKRDVAKGRAARAASGTTGRTAAAKRGTRSSSAKKSTGTRGR